ncbi:class I SAM-dependent methyltransferase [Alteromonas sp. 5E99-2]|uniref:class I SAM-dependent methyltransferase n=1 Tax=Alteromonas sp. 5E99-2 TaxID=2817683 RepID=UPI001F611356|nr:class I SAM-dependent methyltransferase [Alteromonas sp. 5E99-2]
MCESQQLDQFSSIIFGVWQVNGNEMSRDSGHYPIAQCLQCGHVQVAIQYTSELFQRLYFHSEQAPIMWHESKLNDDTPYQEMYEFAGQEEHIDTIVDFGCGEGKLLAAANRANPNAKLFGIDFNDRFSQQGITYLSHDLNKLSSLEQSHWPQGISLAMASHVLEHIENPVVFLRGIKELLSENGRIFIEVPDFSNPHNEKSIGVSNLINMQHIHYFSVDTLRYTAQLAGLEVKKYSQFSTGDVPRLQFILSKPCQDIAIQHIKSDDAQKSVFHFQAHCQRIRETLTLTLIEEVEQQGTVGLWGIGADFYSLLCENRELIELIKSKKIKLFDQQYSDKYFLTQKVLSSSKISNVSHNIYISVFSGQTRVKMLALSQEFKNVIDVYAMMDSKI